MGFRGICGYSMVGYAVTPADGEAILAGLNGMAPWRLMKKGYEA